MYNDVDRARAVLQQGLDACPTCKSLLEGAIFFEETLPGDDRVQRVLSLYDRPLAVKVSSSQTDKQDGKQESDGDAAAAGDEGEEVQQDTQQAGFADDVLEDLSKHSIEFADMYADVATVRRLQQRHSKLFGLPPAAAATKGQAGSSAEDAARKRPADAAAGATANGHVAKAARTDTVAGASDSAANAAAAAAAAAGYYPPPPAAGYGGYGMPPYGHPGYPPAYGHYGYGY